MRGRIENVGAPTFLGRRYSPVFAYVGERKGLWTGRVYGGETLGLRRKWEEQRNAFNTEDAEDAEEEGEEGKKEGGGMGGGRIRI